MNQKPLIHMPGGLSAHSAMLQLAQEAADAAAVNALNVIAVWLHEEKGNPELAAELLETFGAPSEAAAEPVPVDPAPAAVSPEPAPKKAGPEDAILITGEV